MDQLIRLLTTAKGPALALAGWLLLRWVARSPLRWSLLLPLDLLLPASCFGLILAATAKPVFAGIITLALAGGFAYADRAKLKVLAEPVMFTDVFQAFDIFRHPQLALPFPNKGAVLAGVLAVVGFFTLLYLLEPAAWTWTPWPSLSGIMAFAAVMWALGGRYSARVAAALRGAGVTGDPSADAARFGTFGALLAYGIIASGERPLLQAAAQPSFRPAAHRRTLAQPLVLVQCESFFDARRLHPAVPRNLLPHFDRCQRGGVQWGRLEVPCWGANTVRTEFAVLSGLAERDIGFDRFNPYHRFSRIPVTSLAWQLRAEGYRTVCIHPFDRSFYGRDQVMPNLGFDRFLGEEAFSGAERSNGYISDVAAAAKAEQVLREEGPGVFIFIITMENHGPWTGPRQLAVGAGLADGLPLPDAERLALQRYLHSLRSADEMIGRLSEAVGADGMLAFYGDHLPAFAGVFQQFGLEDRRSDYLIWRQSAGRAAHRDIRAHNLADAILDAMALPQRLGKRLEALTRAVG